MSTKYYRVKTDTFMWDEGAIISSDGEGYRSIDELYDHVELKDEYVNDHIVENTANAAYFERVYKVELGDRTRYLPKAEARKFLADDKK